MIKASTPLVGLECNGGFWTHSTEKLTLPQSARFGSFRPISDTRRRGVSRRLPKAVQAWRRSAEATIWLNGLAQVIDYRFSGSNAKERCGAVAFPGQPHSFARMDEVSKISALIGGYPC